MGEDAGTDAGRTRGAPEGNPRRVTLREAAVALGVSEGAVRKRVTRGTLASDIGEDGRRYVHLEAAETEADTGEDEGSPAGEGAPTDALLEAYQRENELLRDTLAAERRANEENRRIIAGLVQRIPELEAPPQSAQEAESVAESASWGESREESSEGRAEPESAGERRVPWWRRIFSR